MNAYQTQLWNELMALLEGEKTAFYSQDFNLVSGRFRIFNYRLASYTQFERPSGREARGTMFEIDDQGQPIRLASLPMNKFHNINECPLTMNLDLSEVDTIEVKADGSLISTYVTKFIGSPALAVKSKGSCSSQQVIEVSQLLAVDNDLAQQLLNVTHIHGYTVNAEYCSPTNRIVLGYDKPVLTILNARSMEDGSYATREQLKQWLPAASLIEQVHVDDVKSFVQSIPNMTESIEGYVCRIGDLWFKCKTDQYVLIHQVKSDLLNPAKRLEIILNESVDDLMPLIQHDDQLVKEVLAQQEKASIVYNTISTQLDNWWAQHRELGRKEYAISMKALVPEHLFGCMMNRYLGKPVDLKGVMLKRCEEFQLI